MKIHAIPYCFSRLKASLLRWMSCQHSFCEAFQENLPLVVLTLLNSYGKWIIAKPMWSSALASEANTRVQSFTCSTRSVREDVPPNSFSAPLWSFTAQPWTMLKFHLWNRTRTRIRKIFNFKSPSSQGIIKTVIAISVCQFALSYH